jgi:uncharacterized FlgJ-related protein
MKIVFTSIFVGISFLGISSIEKQLSKREYFEQWKNTAIQQMIQYKIPASITMAQGILESGNGNSELARKANNHFGIKCHDWDGATMYMDDDSKGECFRVYTSAEESYVDHSEFLKNKGRYSKLFSLEIGDYKSWANGLKEAGYATNPKYAELLIGIIEELKLDELDKLGESDLKPQDIAQTSKNNLMLTKHVVSTHENKVKFIIARKGDTYFRISKEFDVALWQLYKYNDFGSKKDFLEEGDLVYLQPKRNRSRTKAVLVLKEATTLISISQKEAINIESLLKMNKDILSENQNIFSGKKVILR